MSHDQHHHAPVNHNRAFAIGIALNLAFVLIEAIFGFFAHSLALLADAGHNLSDVLGLLLAWGAIYLSRRPPTKRRTYGLRRSSILAALANAIFLLIAIGGIAWEAIQRFKSPAHVAAGTVIWVAVVGIVINSATAILFMSGRKRDMNIEGAYLHMATDAAVSLGVVVAGIIIWYTGRYWIDPVVSLLIVAVITVGTWGLLRRSVDLALDAVPEGIDPAAVRDYLAGLPGVSAIHDLHIWAMSTTEAALTAHLVRPQATDDDQFLHATARALHDRFAIEHVTIQVERGTGAEECHLERDGAV